MQATCEVKQFPKVVVKKLGRQKLFGLALHDLNEIHIDPRQTEREFMGTLLHEATHLAAPDLNEDAVERIEAVLTYVMWTQGYRRKP